MTVGQLIRELADEDPTLEVFMSIANIHQAPVGQVVTEITPSGTRVLLDDYKS